jgi:hypothetical protein
MQNLLNTLVARGLIASAEATEETVAQLADALDRLAAEEKQQADALAAEKTAHEATRKSYAEAVVNAAVKEGRIDDTPEARATAVRCVLAAGHEAVSLMRPPRPPAPTVPRGSHPPVPVAKPLDSTPQSAREAWADHLSRK